MQQLANQRIVGAAGAKRDGVVQEERRVIDPGWCVAKAG
jgi:hypothetical protein